MVDPELALEKLRQVTQVTGVDRCGGDDVSGRPPGSYSVKWKCHARELF